MAHVRAGKAFTAEQEAWLALIREHLVQNLTIELDDFQLLPIFERQGGMSRASSVLAGSIEPLVTEIDEAVAG
jgi:type I restriction enzyme, R subunit